MIIMHEGSCLFVPRSDGTKLMLAEDVTLTEACEIMIADAKRQSKWLDLPEPITGVAVRKTLRKPVVRKPSDTGWPKS